MNPDDIEAALDLDVVENEEERGDGDHLFAKSETEPPSEATSVVDANSLPPPPGAPHAVAPSSKRSFKSDPFLSAGEKPPKRFKSSFIFFSIEKHKEIKDLMSVEGGPKVSDGFSVWSGAFRFSFQISTPWTNSVIQCIATTTDQEHHHGCGRSLACFDSRTKNQI